jgi:hypothetical protein
LEAGSVWKAKIQRNESNISNVYSVLDKKKDEDWWGWIIYEE